MSFTSVVDRHRDMLELDWMAEAEAIWDSKVLMTADGVSERAWLSAVILPVHLSQYALMGCELTNDSTDYCCSWLK